MSFDCISRPVIVRMACLDEVPFKIPLGSLKEVKEEVDLVTAPEITVPDYLKALQETEVRKKQIQIKYLL